MSGRRAALLACLVVLLGALVLPGPAQAVDPLPSPCKSDAPRPAAYPNNGAPRANAPMGAGTYFSYPNRTKSERLVIMSRVINTINSTWGAYDTPVYAAQNPGCPTQADPNDPSKVYDADGKYVDHWVRRRGTIKMTTWSFNHWDVRDALVRAEQRGAIVQIIAAQGINETGVDGTGPYKPWVSVRNYLRTYGKDTGSYAWECRGACRGAGGTPHSKFFLFTDVGYGHVSDITVQTSMNLTQFAVSGQWNQAVVMWRRADVAGDFRTIFNQSRPDVAGGGYARWNRTGVANIFFPGGSYSRDPVLQALNRVRCTGATSGGINGRTRIRVIQYSIYDTRGVEIAKKLRGLWNAGCNVRIIYSVTSRPVLKILRSTSGRGRIPMKQSVIKNSAGEIVKYNHSKWLAIGGNYYGISRGTWTVVSGSSNWSNFAYQCDEQMQQNYGYAWTNPFFKTFDKTWNQASSRPPTYGGTETEARMAPEPVIGQGIYKYMEND